MQARGRCILVFLLFLSGCQTADVGRLISPGRGASFFCDRPNLPVAEQARCGLAGQVVDFVVKGGGETDRDAVVEFFQSIANLNPDALPTFDIGSHLLSFGAQFNPFHLSAGDPAVDTIQVVTYTNTSDQEVLLILEAYGTEASSKSLFTTVTLAPGEHITIDDPVGGLRGTTVTHTVDTVVSGAVETVVGMGRAFRWVCPTTFAIISCRSCVWQFCPGSTSRICRPTATSSCWWVWDEADDCGCPLPANTP